jgi:hypothetical protein
MKTIKITQANNENAFNYLTTELNMIIDENKNAINNITTNANVCYTLLQGPNTKSYTLNNNQKIYPFGNYEGYDLNFDAYQKWDDNKIYLKKDEEIIATLEFEDENMVLI